MSSKPDIKAILGRSQIFGALDEAARDALAAEMRPAVFSAGQVIFARGDQGKELYVVLSGRVRLSVLTADGRELSFMHAGAGSIFGEIAMLDGKDRTADATAVQATEALTLSHGAMLRAMAGNPAMMEAIVEFLCQRLREADMQLEGVALHRIEVRLARFLTGLALQVSQDRDNQDDDTVDVELGMSQGELALLLGASRPKVNAAMKMLEDQGAVTRTSESVGRLICDLEMLRVIAELE